MRNRMKYLRWVGVAVVLLAAIVAGLLYFHAKPSAAITPYPHELAQGELCRGRRRDSAWSQCAPPLRLPETGVAGWGALFVRCEPTSSNRADFGFVNLETPVAPAHSHGSKPFLFDAPIVLRGRAQGQRHQDRFIRQQPCDGSGLGGLCRDARASAREGMLFAGSGDTAQQSLAAGHHRGQRHQESAGWE